MKQLFNRSLLWMRSVYFWVIRQFHTKMTAEEKAEESVRLTNELFNFMEGEFLIVRREVNEIEMYFGLNRLLVRTTTSYAHSMLRVFVGSIKRSALYPNCDLTPVPKLQLRKTLEGSNWHFEFAGTSTTLRGFYERIISMIGNDEI